MILWIGSEENLGYKPKVSWNVLFGQPVADSLPDVIFALKALLLAELNVPYLVFKERLNKLRRGPWLPILRRWTDPVLKTVSEECGEP